MSQQGSTMLLLTCLKREVDSNVEIHHTDVAQGYLGDCYFLAALGAVAKANPEAIRELITAKDDGTYDVKLYLRKKKFFNWSGLSPIIVNVTADLAVNSSHNLVYAKEGDSELWVALVEKAYAKLNGTEDKSAYQNIVGGFGNRGIETIVGHQASKFNPKRKKQEEWAKIIQDALVEDRAITAGTRFKLLNKNDRWVLANQVQLYGLHEYYVINIDLAGKEIELRNPHNNTSYPGGNIFKIPFDDFLEYFNAVSVEI